MNDQNRPTVLCCDDDPDVLRSLENVLLQGGYEVLVSSSGDEALGILDGELPDLILMDAVMPEMDGYEVLRQIRQKRTLDDVPVIFVTSLREEKDRKKAFALGAADYVEKPFEVASLLETIQVHLGRTREPKPL